MAFKGDARDDRKGGVKLCLIPQVVYMPEKPLPLSFVSFDPLCKIDLCRPHIKIITLLEIYPSDLSYVNNDCLFYV